MKKAVTDAQNVALDSLRIDDNWHPDGQVLAEMMQADLKGLWAESYSAGHAAAEEMAGAKLKRKDTPPSRAAGAFGGDLAGAVSTRSSAPGMDSGEAVRDIEVFRGWRTDEAERRVRQLAPSRVSPWVGRGSRGGQQPPVGGQRHSMQRLSQAATEPGSHLPPVHAGCECTVVLAGV